MLKFIERGLGRTLKSEHQKMIDTGYLGYGIRFVDNEIVHFIGVDSKFPLLPRAPEELPVARYNENTLLVPARAPTKPSAGNVPRESQLQLVNALLEAKDFSKLSQPELIDEFLRREKQAKLINNRRRPSEQISSAFKEWSKTVLSRTVN